MMDRSRSGQEVDIHASHGGGGAGGDDGDKEFGGRGHEGGRTSRVRGGAYDASDNSSEEAIYLKRQPPPEGKIGVRTDIATFYEDA